jgi:predicted ABC-type transport system involved in lysophospholipase L1 biosynthesis ATPase subunit
MTTPVLSLKNASLSLDGNAGRVDILHGINLDIETAETVGLVGPSGSGKSSLLMLMGGLEQATSGTIHALSHDLTAMNEDALARFRRDHMGVVFQSFHLIPTMTALENVVAKVSKALLAGVNTCSRKLNRPPTSPRLIPDSVSMPPSRARKPMVTTAAAVLPYVATNEIGRAHV